MGKPISLQNYADILKIVRDNPSSAAKVSQATGFRVENIRLCLRRMHALGLVHIIGWTPKAYHTVPRPIYREGAGTDVPPPLTNQGRPSRHQAAQEIRIVAGANLVAFSVVVKMMKAGPSHRIELAAESGTNHDNLCKLVRHMHRIGLVHVADYERGRSGVPKQLMAWGEKKDKPRPPRLVRPTSREAYAKRKQVRMLSALAGIPWSPSANAPTVTEAA